MLTEDNALSLTEALRKGTGQQLLDGVLRWKKKLKTAPGGPIFALEDREGLVEHTIIATLDLANGETRRTGMKKKGKGKGKDKDDKGCKPGSKK